MASELRSDDTLVQVVDDHPATAEGLGLLLNRPGIRILPPVVSVDAVDPEAGIVICDLILRGAPLTGRRAIEYLVNDLGLGVVATSGFAQPRLIADSIAAGASSFVSKDGPFPATLWQYALEAAAASGRFVTSRLAEALLKDVSLRPLPAGEDHTEDGLEFLHVAVQDADSEVTRHLRQWDDPKVRSITASIWRVARRRSDAHTIKIPDVLRQAAVLERQGLKQRVIADRLGIAPGTYRGLLGALREQYHTKHAFTTESHAKAMGQTDLLLYLLDLETDESPPQ